MRTFARRKLTKTDGEYILRHVLGHLQASAEYAASYIVYSLLRTF